MKNDRPLARFAVLAPGTLVALALAACGGATSTGRSPSATTQAAPSAPAESATGALPSAGGAGTSQAGAADIDAKLRQAIDGPQRTEQERARNQYRHPVETLEWLGLKDDMTVVELSPGGGWYTSILAPVLRDRGKLIVAGGDPNGDPKSEGTKNARALLARFRASPAVFDKVESVLLKTDQESVFGPPESADMVLTFRNFHNWISRNSVNNVMGAAFKVLKHGGTLGLTDHRANPGASADPKTVGATGYVPEAEVVKLVEAAGFKLVGKSEINANPKDTKDHPKGVWTLPPTYRLGEVDHAKYAAIGESDRMTLKFVKP